MAELTTIERWIMSRLQDDPTLAGVVEGRIFSTIVPQGETYPCILFAAIDPGDDTMTIGNERVWVNEAAYVVRAVGESAFVSYVALEAAANRIDQLLHDQGGTLDSGIVVNCRRRSPFMTSESVKPGLYRSHLGGLYEIIVHAA